MKKKRAVFLLVFFHLLILAKTGQAKIAFSLKASAGYGKIFGGDLNMVLASHDGFYGDLADRLGMSKKGRFEKMSGAPGGKVALMVDLSDKFGIGVGVGYVQSRKESQANLSLDPLYQGEAKIDGKIQAWPIELSAYYKHPISEKWELVIEGGLVYCLGTLSYSMSLDEKFWTTSMKSQTQGAADDRGLGFHGAVGLFFSVAGGIDIFIEGAGRYARLNHWQGEENYSDTEKIYERRLGFLWYYEFYDNEAQATYSNLILSPEKPAGPNIKNARLFDNSLSEISLRVGLRARI